MTKQLKIIIPLLILITGFVYGTFKVISYFKLQAKTSLQTRNDTSNKPAHAFKKQVNVVGVIDEVGLYRKPGMVEVYGLKLHQRRSAPISVSNTEFLVEDVNAYLIWTPDEIKIDDATSLEVQFAEVPQNGSMKIGLTFDNDTTIFFYNFGSSTNVKSLLSNPSLMPAEYFEELKTKKQFSLTHDGQKNFRVDLPPELLKSRREHPLKRIYIVFEGLTGQKINVKYVALTKTIQSDRDTVTLSGKVTGTNIGPGQKVELMSETGKCRKTFLSLDGSFLFNHVPGNLPVSLRYTHNDRKYYVTLGRWFVPADDRNNLEIKIKPDYINADNHAPDPSKAKFVTPRSPLSSAAVYENHARQHWPGGSNIQVYDSTVFTNNHGYVDMDRFYENPDQNIRIVHLGSSHAVALQIPLHQKYNVLLEEELGISLQRPVEVISAGIDNGDIGANYPRIINYAEKFKPHMVLIECGSSLVTQLSPQLLKDGFGWDHNHSGTPNFYYDDKGTLQFRVAAADYGLFATKPTYPSYTQGIPFFDTVRVPFEQIHPNGKEAYDYLISIVNYIKNKHPNLRVVLQTGLDHAQCLKNRENTVTLAEQTIRYGSDVFVENIKQLRYTNNIESVHPLTEPYLKDDQTLFTFRNDGHYSPFGHQWLAQELAKELIPLLKESKDNLR